MELNIRNRHALLTGASRGLGRACAERLAAAGAHITLVAREEAPLRSACAELASTHGVRTHWITADIGAPDGRAHVLNQCPNPDILVLSSGWPAAHLRSGAWDAQAWASALDAMLLGQVQLIGTLSQGMAQRRFGRIVAVTSRLIKEPEFELAMPAAARLGLTAYIKALSRELARHNVTVNSILPGIFNSETQLAHTERLMQEQGLAHDEVVARRAALTPAGRFGTPQEFSALCAYLCSDDAGFMTGQALTLDGGAHAGIW